MLSVGRHAKVTAYGKAGGGEGNALQSGSREFQRKIVLLERPDGPARKKPEGWCLGERGERKIRSHPHVRHFALHSAGLTPSEVGKPREITAAGR